MNSTIIIDCTPEFMNFIRNDFNVMSFILYRLEIRDESLRELALCMLPEFPDYSIHIVTYLSLFKDDERVIQTLVDVANTSFYSEVRINCVENALIPMFGKITDRIRQ